MPSARLALIKRLKINGGNKKADRTEPENSMYPTGAEACNSFPLKMYYLVKSNPDAGLLFTAYC
ncbi:hypothetical protein A8C56_01435 [Niabella ginsenosidivorans]|uniref:Uncharacterized protein n=1 Tax=Niabella ginsenosidivorans TaxID=1176587 RepID=A0A1A9HZG0_9BACT|nr:hypothetical protein A8C56_01435 [Niabella ginsenosidivorans]